VTIADALRACFVRSQAEGKQGLQLPSAARPVVGLVLSNAVLAAPAFAEAGKIFDFNATLPLMAGQFLLLMLVLDKLVYSPVGKVLDDRDKDLRTKLEAVKDNAGDLMKYTTEADGIIRAARDEAAAEINKAKSAAEAESAKEVGAAKAKLDAELKSAVAALEQQRQASMASIDAEVTKLSDSIVNKVLSPA
jgi:F-type H+-transporting ATPase subunit b